MLPAKVKKYSYEFSFVHDLDVTLLIFILWSILHVMLGAARRVCRAGSMKRSDVRLSVCPSVCPITRQPHSAGAGLLLCARRTGDTDRLLHGAQQQLRRSTAHSSKCGQCHVVSRRRKLDTDRPVLVCRWTANAVSAGRLFAHRPRIRILSTHEFYWILKMPTEFYIEIKYLQFWLKITYSSQLECSPV